jgi:hypothetical protein
MKYDVCHLNPSGNCFAANGMQTWCYYGTGTSEMERIVRVFNILLTYTYKVTAQSLPHLTENTYDVCHQKTLQDSMGYYCMAYLKVVPI